MLPWRWSSDAPRCCWPRRSPVPMMRRRWPGRWPWPSNPGIWRPEPAGSRNGPWRWRRRRSTEWSRPMTEVSAPRVPVVNPGPLVDPVDALDRDELDRYSRHLSLPGFGVEGQKRLRAASVLVIGAGGLGAPVLNYLAAAGIGSITIIDDDAVETSNLQRQVIHRRVDVGRQKVDSAAAALHRLDPDLNVTTIEDRLSPDNALELFADHDVVLDGADNFATRYLSNDAAELTGTPLVWGTIFRFAGQVSTFAPGHGPMLRDLFPDIPDPDSVPNCAEGG